MPPRKRPKTEELALEPRLTRSKARKLALGNAATAPSHPTEEAAPQAPSGARGRVRATFSSTLDESGDVDSGCALASDATGGDPAGDDASEDVDSDERSAAAEDSNAGDEAQTQRSFVEDSADDVAFADGSPPEALKPEKKLTGRKQFAADAAALSERFACAEEANDGPVAAFTRDGADDLVQITLRHQAFPRGLNISLYFPELSGYPRTHEVLCFAGEEEVFEEVQAAVEEIARLPPQADRSLEGLLEHLVHRIVRKGASRWGETQARSQQQDSDEEGSEYEEELYTAGPPAACGSPSASALREDFGALIGYGYLPGFVHLSDFDRVVSVGKKVSLLGVPARALQAWDSLLVTGQDVYLVLLMNLGPTYPVDLANPTAGSEIEFRVGISPTYKPSRAAIAAAFRAHSSNPYTPGDFEAISLSNPLNSLMNSKFSGLVQTRRENDGVGWAGAEEYRLAAEPATAPLDKKAARAADKEEQDTVRRDATSLPQDPMDSAVTAQNVPLLAFTYLVRRFVMCPRFCLNCFRRCDQSITALKPFVCNSPLCLFQLIQLGLGPSLEHEIVTNPAAVDLLVQLAYVAAKDGGLKGDLIPVGLGLEASRGGGTTTEERLELDTLGNESYQCEVIVALINELPPISEMRAWLLGEDMTLQDRLMHRTRKLSEMRNRSVSVSAWRLLRFIVASNTSYLKHIEDQDELVQGIPPEYRQFRFVVGDPAKEHRLAESIKKAQKDDPNAVKYPTLLAWHGSSVRNWHSILRQGLHFREVINGRAYGHGVYFALQGETSLGTYAHATTTVWPNAEFPISKMAALCEVTNRPSRFVSTTPYLVCNKLDWIQCRVLIGQRSTIGSDPKDMTNAAEDPPPSPPKVKTIPLDPAYPVTLHGVKIAVPDVDDKLQRLQDQLGDDEDELHDSDVEILKAPLSPTKDVPRAPKEAKVEDSFEPADSDRLQLVKMLPPPSNPNRTASSMIQSQMKAMLATQQKEGPIEAGFYFDPRSNDNLFTWIVELPLGSFDQTIPLAKDMEQKGVKSILMEIRFGDSYPFSPPFFRVVHPRFLPFVHGGGGHVTGGGSICMDLLTNDGWSSVYTVEAILLQIRMAMSNLEPRPARLDPSTWNQPYSMSESIQGFKRAAATHGWTVPAELDSFARQG
ncbi:hypothetical protein JCM8202v2_003288 [Rhodotorula sphaerocarpa]